tara:strand:+ start:498 stop:698 length:201 start_codon:yes stop_codon:yes gene_type:complete
MKYKSQERYKQKNLERGLIKTTVWIPKQNKHELRSIAQDMRDKHEELQLGWRSNNGQELEASNHEH